MPQYANHGDNIRRHLDSLFVREPNHFKTQALFDLYDVICMDILWQKRKKKQIFPKSVAKMFTADNSI